MATGPHLGFASASLLVVHDEMLYIISTAHIAPQYQFVYPYDTQFMKSFPQMEEDITVLLRS